MIGAAVEREESGGVGGNSHGEAGRSLLVYIPTYNRPQALRRQLASLKEQRLDWPGRLRVVVSDNASTMVTEDELASMAQEFGVEVRRNHANVGANANIAFGFALPHRGEFLWVLGDDDFIREGALRAMAPEVGRDNTDGTIFSVNVKSPTTVVHRWEKAWQGVEGSGLISNVVYRADTFAPWVDRAFLFHNTSFPHLAVMLSALASRGTLRYRSVPVEEIFTLEVHSGEQPGNYALSLSGLPQLMTLLPVDEARRFAKKWLREQGLSFFRCRDAYPAVHVGTMAILRAYGGVGARLSLRLLAAEHFAYERIGGAVTHWAKGYVARHGMPAVYRILPRWARRRARAWMGLAPSPDDA